MTDRPVFAGLPDELIVRADEACDRLEAAWRAGGQPRVEDLLTGFDGPARAALIAELLHLEVAYRRQRGETPTPDEYSDRFPGLAPDHLTRIVGRPAGPRRIGRFELLERIGAGGFGAVWRARDAELDRTVAVKLPHPGLLDSPAALSRFRREARAAARLRHPGVAAVHDAGVVDGVPVLVTEFIPGASLRDLLRARRLTFREAAEVVAAAADALDYTHQMGALHRDVKPANIIIADDPEGRPGCLGRPVLVDFGLARVGADGASLTLAGQVFGTPAYMSPEQAAGNAHLADARTDVYGLGAVLYELLTGRAPFAGSGSAVLQQVLREVPRPPRRVNPAVPRDLETVCLKALARESHRRYPRAADLADDLRRWLRREPVRARPVGPVGRG
ncbi:MAG: serine/threonine protein kinase, partial [Gemmataceae bacterium]|nr:serine/threonine protein kinase [Gemmataceae bacterium]